MLLLTPPAEPAAAEPDPSGVVAAFARSSENRGPRGAAAATPAAAAPSATVVVCTRNRAEGLRRALESLTKLNTTGLRADVLVVDNGSTDHTARVVEEVAAASPIPVRRVFEPVPGIAHARQRGVRESRGEWIASFDDDQLAESDWLRELFALAREKNVRFVGGRVTLSLPDGHADRPLAPFTRMLLGASVDMPAPRPYDVKTTPGAGNMMAHRSVFETVGAFDATLDRGEDTDFFMRALAAGVEAWYTPAALVHHCIPETRMGDDYLYRICDVIGNGTAERDLDRFGRARLPAMWVARLGQTALSLLPQWAFAKLFCDAETERGRRCRLRVGGRYLIDGARYAVGLPVVPPC